MNNAVYNFCMNCKKPKCKGDCEERREFVKELIKKRLLRKRGGKKTIKKEPV